MLVIWSTLYEITKANVKIEEYIYIFVYGDSFRDR